MLVAPQPVPVVAEESSSKDSPFALSSFGSIWMSATKSFLSCFSLIYMRLTATQPTVLSACPLSTCFVVPRGSAVDHPALWGTQAQNVSFLSSEVDARLCKTFVRLRHGVEVPTTYYRIGHGSK